MKGLYLKITIGIFLIFAVSNVNAQRGNGIAVEGKISVQVGSVEGAIIQMYQDGRRLDNYGVGADGRYKVELNYNHKFELVFELENNFSQRIVIDSHVPRNVLESDPKFPSFPVNINLFTEVPGVDNTFSQKTVLKIYYNSNVDNFISELYYNDAQIKKLIDQAILQSKMIGKEADYLSKLTRAEIAELRREYNQLIEQAGKEYNGEKFLAALDGFKAASKIFPSEQFPKDRIAEINDLLGLIMAASELDKALAERFATLIKEGDLQFNQSNYSDARTSYNRALSIKPRDAYALGQVKKISDLLNRELAENQYVDLIDMGDKAFDEILYTEAKRKYQDALQIKPNENYPKNRIEEINTILVDQTSNAQKQESYKQAIFQAELMFEKQFYDKSLSAYQNALNIKPGDLLATRKIEEVKEVMKKITDKMQYNKLVKAADKSYKKKLYAEALEDYSEANILFPNESHPKNRIQEIQDILDLKESFTDLVFKADKQFISKNYEASKSFYASALKIQEDDKHSMGRIREIDAILASQGVDAQYRSLVAEADGLFNSSNYENARDTYNRALQVKPKEKYPKEKIAEINLALQQIAKTDKDYREALVKADGLFKQKNYERAIPAFELASKIKPDEGYPSEMLTEINGIIEEQVRLAEVAAASEVARLAAIQAETDKNYSDAIAKADEFFNQQEYDKARNEYRTAATVKSEETYPQQKIEEIGTILAQLSATQKAYEDAIKNADGQFRRENFDAAKQAFIDAKTAKSDESYPDEMLVEIDSIVETRARLASEAEAEKVRLAEVAAAMEVARLAAIQAEMDKNYSDAIAKADEFFNQQDYDKARNEYRTAATVKSEETYPQQKIEEIGAIMAELSAAQKAYETAVARADLEFRREEFEAAKLAFNDAKTAKSDELYPVEMLVKIDSIVETRARLVADAEAEQVRLAEVAVAVEVARLAAIQAARDKNYSDAIAKADEFFNQQDYDKARNEYRTAVTVKSDETYPQQKIEEIGAIMAELSAAQKAYENAIARADLEFRREEFETAKQAFNEAKTAKSDELYPVEMLVKIDSIVETRARLVADAEAEQVRIAEVAAAAEVARLAAIQAEKDKSYSEAISKADVFFNQQDYNKARNEYRTASRVKTDENYPQQRILEIGTRLEELELARQQQDALNKKYAGLIQQAGRLFSSNEYLSSKGKYEAALQLKPDEAYPKERIAEIEDILRRQKTDEQYRLIIVAADGFFKEKAFVEAKIEYEKAIVLKPNEAYPKSQINKINDILEEEQQGILAEQKATENLQQRTLVIAQMNEEIDARNVESEAELKSLYAKFIIKADAFFNDKQYNVARAWYYRALEIMPEEMYPQQRIDEINRIISGMMFSQRDRDYQNYINLGDSTFRGNQLAVARGWYNQALGIKGEEPYPKSQIAEIQNKIAERIAGQTGQQFEQNIEKASKAFDEQNYNVSRFWYKKALELRPNDEAAKARLLEIQGALN